MASAAARLRATSRQLSTVQFGASPLLIDSARDARNWRSQREMTADPTWLSGARLRASWVRTLETHCAIAWRPDAACAGGGAASDAKPPTMAADTTARSLECMSFTSGAGAGETGFGIARLAQAGGYQNRRGSERRSLPGLP
jgi:hypothetical protein